MKPIQPILILFLLVIAIVYFLRLRNKTYDRLIVLFIILGGILLVLMPDLSAEIASIVGVGRGADLLLYLGLVGLLFICLLLYSKVRELEAALTDVVRGIAIAEARIAGNPLEETSSPAMDKEETNQ
jgi:hypothetical protein